MVCWNVQQRCARPPTAPQRLQEIANKMFGEEAVALDEAVMGLQQQDLLLSQADGLSLGLPGETIASKLHNEHFRVGFEAGLVRLFESKAHAEASRRINGTGLQQLNMVDGVQLEHLCAQLALAPGERVVDLGCATGLISEYLSDRYDVHVTGMDFARPAIAEARARTDHKSERLAFLVGDLNNIELKPGLFDVAISVDTLYFVTSLEQVVREIFQLVRPGGRVGIFWSQKREPEQPPATLEADRTEVARSIHAQGLTWQVREFTREARMLWERTVSIYDELKADFEAEGCLDLWKDLYNEAVETRKAHERQQIRRYFYLINVPPSV